MINKLISNISDKQNKKSKPNEQYSADMPTKNYSYKKDELWSQEIDFLIDIITKQEEYIHKLIDHQSEQLTSIQAIKERNDLIGNTPFKRRN